MKSLLVLLLCLFLGVGLMAQTKVTGTVVDEDNLPVPGASVVIKGTNVGIVADSDGKFTIDVPEGSTILIVSSIGKENQDVTVRPTVSVTLKNDSQMLDDVVVIAYGTAKRSSFTGSASVIKSDAIKNFQAGSVTKSLAGQTAGVQVASTSGRPGADADVRIRGVGSINASSKALYVLDGIPFEGNINSISSDDIESMSVLKDAAANSLYGARGANGVVLITTKKGKTGAATVSFQAKAGVNSRAVPRYETVDNVSDFYEMAWDQLRNTYQSNGQDWMTAGLNASNNLIPQLGGYNVSTNTPNGQIVNPQTGRVNTGVNYMNFDPWRDEMFINGKHQEYQVSVSGGTENTKYYISSNYYNNEGLVKNSGFERFSNRIKVDQKVNKWLRLEGGMMYTKTKTKFSSEASTEGANMFYIDQTMGPIYPIYEYDLNGNMVLDKKGEPIFDFGDGEYNGQHVRPVSGLANPIASNQLDKDETDADNFMGNGLVEIRFLKDFKFTSNLSLTNVNLLNQNYKNAKYGQFKNAGGISGQTTQRQEILTANQLLNWTRKFNSIHNLEVLAGHENYSYTLKYISAIKSKFLDPDNTELVGAISDPKANSLKRAYKGESYFSRVMYDYDGKYFGSASFRTDGSSRFKKGNQWGKFWSVGASWLITKEDFMSNISWVDELKLKSSYGTQGNDNLGDNVSPWADQYSVVPNGDDLSLTFAGKGNPNLTWEKSHSFNVGMEFEVLNKRLMGSFEYFSRRTTDLLFQLPQSPSAGFAAYPGNAGELLNNGLELELKGIVIKTNELEWIVSANATHTKSKITSLPDSYKEIGFITGAFKYTEGEDRYRYYVREYAGVNENGQSTWNTDKYINGVQQVTTEYSAATRYFSKDALPFVYGGISTNFTWREFDLNIQTSYQLGGYGYDVVYAGLMHNGNGQLGNSWHKDMYNRWTVDNQNSDIPRLGNDAAAINTSDRFIISSDYFSINNITLGYNLPKALLKKIKLSTLRFSVSVDNLALFSKRKGYDPRNSIIGANAAGSYTQPRIVSMGLNLKF